MSLDSAIGKNLFKSSSVIFLINIIGTVISFAFQLLIARILPIDEFGYYVYVITWINFLVLVAKVGLDISTLKYLPNFIANKKYNLYWQFLKFTTQFLFYSSILSMAILIVSVYFLPLTNEELKLTFVVSSVLIPVLVFSQVIGSQLQVFKRLALSAFCQNLLKPLLIMLVVFINYYFDIYENNAVNIMLINIMIATIIVFVLFWVRKEVSSIPLVESDEQLEKKKWVSVTIPMFLITSCNYLINQLDVIMLGYFVGTKEAAIYAVASRITMFLQFVLTAVNGVAAPLISEYHSNGMKSELLKVVKNSAWIAAVSTIPGALILIVFSYEILSIFGEKFIYAEDAMMILAVARSVNSLTGVSGYLLSMTGNHLAAVKILSLSLIINIILNIMLIPNYAGEGAAIATLVASIFWGCAMSIYASKRLDVNPTIFQFGR